MLAFVFRRIAVACERLLLISAIVFGLLHGAPGGAIGPYRQSATASTADIAQLEADLGPAQPLALQYFHWLALVSRGNFGYLSPRAPIDIDCFDPQRSHCP